MPRRFRDQVTRLRLQAQLAMWGVAMADLHDMLADVEARLAGTCGSAASTSPGDARIVEALRGARYALDSDLNTLEMAMVEAQAMLKALGVP